MDNEKLSPVIEKVSEHVASSFPSYINASDIAQNLWLWVLENSNTVSNLIEDDESWEKKIYATLKRVAYTSALAEEAETNGYSPEDVYCYTTEVIRTLLEDVFDYEDWQSFQTFGDGQPKSKGLANQTGDRIAMLADVKSAVEKLTLKQQEALVAYFGHFHNYERLGVWLSLTPGGARDRVVRAVDAVRKQLGRKSPADMRQGFTGRQKRYGVAEAQAITERNYEG